MATAKIAKVARLANGRVQLQILGSSGDTYTIQASSNFTGWQVIAVGTASDEDVIEFEDAEAARYPSRFYRLLSP